jgi:hypothetical protein
MGNLATLCFVLASFSVFFGLVSLITSTPTDNSHPVVSFMEAAGAILAISVWSFFWCQLLHIRAGIERSNELLEHMITTRVPAPGQ